MSHPSPMERLTQREKPQDSEIKAIDTEGDAQEEKSTDEKYTYVPWGVTSFAAFDAVKEAREKAREMMTLIDVFTQIAENIMWLESVENKAAAISSLSRELASRLDAETKAVNEEEGDEAETLEYHNSFNVVKQANGQYRWLGIWTNNIEDRDNPPDIIAKDSILDYVDRINIGQLDFPELWMFHVEGTKFGTTDMIAYIPYEGPEDIGYAIATGLIDEDCKDIAESLANSKDELGMSHGMKNVVRRVIDNKNVIVYFDTFEISVLPKKFAAVEDSAYYS